jgi:hydrogenase nickel incorporation protein HypB
MEIKILQSLLVENDAKAAEIREILRQKKILMVNIISAPGSGKTSLLEKTLPLLATKYKIAVIEGDVETDRDAKRLDNYNVPIALINTQGSCHLASVSIEKAFQSLNLDNLDLIFVENIGNLVCPAEFDLGEDIKIAMVSTPEGDDKPIKYPLLFREAALVILNKIDLLEYLDFKRESFYNDLKKIKANLPVIELSCRNNFGIATWLEWLQNKITGKQQNLS